VEVCNADSQLLCTFADQLTLLSADGMSNLGTVNAVLHHQNFQLADVVDDELLEAIREHMTGLSGRAITDVWHQVLSLEATSDTIVNTLGFTPVLLQIERNRQNTVQVYNCNGGDAYLYFNISVRLMANELLSSLLETSRLECWANCHLALQR
jgi:hypothetical protein